MKKLPVILAILAALALVGLWLLPNNGLMPFQTQLDLASPGYAAVGADGSYLVVDTALSRVVQTDPNGQVTRVLYGGDSTFFNVGAVAGGPDGSIYVTDIHFAANGNDVASESVLKFPPNRAKPEVIMSLSYGSWETPPRFQGCIRALEIIDGKPYAATVMENGIVIYQEDIRMTQLEVANANLRVQDVAISPVTHTISYTLKNGQVIFSDFLGKQVEILWEGGNDKGQWSVPWAIAMDGQDQVYVTDIGQRNIAKVVDGNLDVVLDSHYDLGDVDQFGAAPLYFQMTVSPDGTIATTDTYGVSFLGETELTTDTFAVSSTLVTQAIFRCLAWAILGLSALFFLGFGIKTLMAHHFFSKNQIILVVAVVATATTALVVSILLPTSQSQSNAYILSGIQSVATAISGNVDGDVLLSFDDLADYDSAEYQDLKANLDPLVQHVDAYYLFYGTDGQSVYRIMDFVGNCGPMMPMDTAYPGSYYEEVMSTGEMVSYEAVADSTGVWTLSLAPIYNGDGDVVALVEVGKNCAILEENDSIMVQNLLLNVLGMVAVLVLVISECTYFGAIFPERKRLLAQPKSSRRVSLAIIRPLTFCLLIADYMQNGFEPIYVNQLYAPYWGLPETFARTLPLSAEVITTAIGAYFCGRYRQKLHLKSLLYGGALVASLGFACRGLAPDVPMFILGKGLTGLGAGALMVGLNTFIAEQGDEETVNRGFSAYFASYLAAINVGIVLGSFLAERTNYSTVYLTSAGLMAVLCFVIYLCLPGSFDPPVVTTQERVKSQKSVFWFLRQWDILVYFLALFMPYLMTSYFLYYFYPLFASGLGISDGLVGQTFLINGLCVIYLGPTLSGYLLKKWRSSTVCFLAGLLCVVGMVLFVFNETIQGALLCILIMGIADSFALTATTIHFSQCKSVERFGFAQATGVKSTLENVAYTMAPFAFSSAMLLGNQLGIALIAGCFALLLLIFLLFSKKKTKG